MESGAISPSSSSRSQSDPAADEDLPDEQKYQTLFWVPMLKESAEQAKSVLQEMLTLIDGFREEDEGGESGSRRFSFERKTVGRRQQILGEYLDSDVRSHLQHIINLTISRRLHS
jgi:hypothetical protein